jgi:hypothetical protein
MEATPPSVADEPQTNPALMAGGVAEELGAVVEPQVDSAVTDALESIVCAVIALQTLSPGYCASANGGVHSSEPLSPRVFQLNHGVIRKRNPEGVVATIPDLIRFPSPAQGREDANRGVCGPTQVDILELYADAINEHKINAPKQRSNEGIEVRFPRNFDCPSQLLIHLLISPPPYNRHTTTLRQQI